MRKLLLVGAPLVIHALSVLVRVALGRRPSRHAMNVEIAILLTLYFLATAGLGIFWVANQQLPPFDLHYLFGYATFALVLAHLAYNARIVVAYLRRPRHRGPSRPMSRVVLGQAGAALAIAGAAFYLGMRAGAPVVPALAPHGSSAATDGARDAQMDAVARYHAISAHTRAGVILRAPSVAWSLPVADRIDRGGAPRIALPPVDLASGSPRSARDALHGVPRARSGRFTRDDLGRLLWASAGITERRGGLDLRASASSGALFPTEIYVLAFDVDDVPDGTYAYAPHEHALVDLGRAPELDPALGLASGPPPTLVLAATSVFRRTGQKYRDRAYRYVLADAGHTLGNTILAAADLGLATRHVPHFDDAVLTRALGVDGVEEAAVALLAMTPAGESASGTPRVAAVPLLASVLLEAARFEPAPPPPSDRLELGATSMAHASTSLSFVGAPDAPSPPAADGAPSIALPPAIDAPVHLVRAIAARRSVRTFERDALRLDELAAVLRLAVGPAPVASLAARVHVVASRVDGIPPGVYRADAGADVLVLGRRGDLGAEAGRAALDQDAVADAPAVVVVTLDRAALASEGARGYRHGFVEAGILGARLYLAAGARGLAGCSVGAFYDDELAAVLGVELGREWPVHVFALGRPTGGG